jgi:hypothetical protein
MLRARVSQLAGASGYRRRRASGRQPRASRWMVIVPSQILPSLAVLDVLLTGRGFCKRDFAVASASVILPWRTQWRPAPTTDDTFFKSKLTWP